jgi:hypothetical protein
MCRVLELGSADKKVTKIFYQKLLAQQLSASVQLCNSNLAKKSPLKILRQKMLTY